MPEITAMQKLYTKVRNVDTSSMLCSFLPHLSAQPRPGATVFHINSAYADDLQKRFRKPTASAFPPSVIRPAVGDGARLRRKAREKGRKSCLTTAILKPWLYFKNASDVSDKRLKNRGFQTAVSQLKQPIYINTQSDF